jgi:hypothetical protein
MSGIYGNSAEDRYFERICNSYTDIYVDLCGCEKTQTDSQNENEQVEIDEIVYDLVDTYNDYYKCPECGYKFTKDDIKIVNIEYEVTTNFDNSTAYFMTEKEADIYIRQSLIESIQDKFITKRYSDFTIIKV